MITIAPSMMVRILLSISLVLILGLGFSGIYQRVETAKRELIREKERAEWMVERKTLQEEKAKAELAAAESKAKSDALIVISEEKKANIASAIREIQQSELEYEARKKQIELEGGTLDNDALARALRADLCAAGFKKLCAN